MRIKPFRKKNPEATRVARASGGKKSAESVERVNRTVYLTVALLLIVLAVAVGMTSAANRAKRGGGTEAPVTVPRAPSSTAPLTSPVPETTLPAPETKPGPDAGTAAVGSAVGGGDNAVEAAGKIPTLSLPAAGAAGKLHDPTIQVFSDTMNEWRVHLGVDIMTEADAPVYAAADGIVTAIESDPLYGVCITVGHSGKAETVYKNLSDTLAEGLKVGDSVKCGQLLGKVGDGAVIELADEPHLHFEMRIDSENVDPLLYLSAGALATLQSTADTAYE